METSASCEARSAPLPYPTSRHHNPSVELVPTPSLLPGLTATGLDLPPDLPFEQWERIGGGLGAIVRVTPWALGDWLNYGERSYGEAYAQAIEATGLDYQTLANARWVAARIEPSRRRERLTWSHHQQVAKLSVEDQDQWLDRAERGDGPDHRWSRARLRAEMAQVLGTRPWDLDEALDRLDTAVRTIAQRWPKGREAEEALGRKLCALGEQLLSGRTPDA